MSFGYHPNSIIRLGCAYDSFEPDIDKTTAGYIEWEDSQETNQTAIASIAIDIREAASLQQLYEAVGVSFSAEANIGLAKGSASFSSLTRSTFETTTATLIITAKKTFPPTIKTGKLRLSSNGKQRLSQAVSKGEILKFRKIVGSHIITQIQKGASLSVIYQLKSSSSQKINELKSSFKAKYGAVSAGGDIFQELKKIDSSLDWSVSAFQLGANLQTNIESIITSSAGDLAAIKEIAKGAISAVTIDEAVPLSFTGTKIGLIDDIIWDGGDDFEASDRVLDLWRAYNEGQFSNLQAATKTYEKIKRLLGTPRALLIEGSEEELSKKLLATTKTLETILNEYSNREYKKDIKPIHTDIIMERLEPEKYLKLPFASCINWVKTAIKVCRGCSGCENYEFHNFEQSFYPTINVLHPDFIAMITLLKHGEPVTTLNNSQIKELLSNNGDASPFYKSTHARTNIYTWGANLVFAKSAELDAAFSQEESLAQYALSITDTEGYTHTVRIGAYGHIANEVIAAQGLTDLRAEFTSTTFSKNEK